MKECLKIIFGINIFFQNLQLFLIFLWKFIVDFYCEFVVSTCAVNNKNSLCFQNNLFD